MAMVDDYIGFLDMYRTSGDVAAAVEARLRDAGFVDIDSVSKLSEGDKVYFRSGNLVAAAVMGSNEFRTIVSHIDAPHLDLKPNPFVEKDGYVYLKTVPYGGVKYFHWVAFPLEIRGTVYTVDGDAYDVSIPTVITDFAPHLDREEDKKSLGDRFDPEKLMPLVALGKKEDVLEKIKDEFGVEEQDFLSADLQLVPSVKPHLFGANREFILAYGHDDRSSVYAELQALLDAAPGPTQVAIFVDREEVGSTTDDSAAAHTLDRFFLKILRLTGRPATMESLLDLYADMRILSADVSAGYDPLYGDLYDKENAPVLGEGVSISKYTGVRGKVGGSEASAAYVAWFRRVLEENDVPYQSATIGKVGKAGGGTVAVYFARRGASVLDVGAPVLSMHAPVEVLAKIDLEATYRAYKSFFEVLD